jgi:hypothetical protein
MGIDARIETEPGECLAKLGDPHNRLNWLLRLAVLDSTLCLRFIDPYGMTVFNRPQLLVLHSEFSSLASRVTEPDLLEAKRIYLERPEGTPKAALEEMREAVETLSLDDLRHHLEGLLRLVSDAVARGPHHYIRFVAD